MSYSNLPSCSKVIKLPIFFDDEPVSGNSNSNSTNPVDDLVNDVYKSSMRNFAKRSTPAEIIEKNLYHQSSAMMANQTSFLRTVNAVCSQIKMTTQKMKQVQNQQKQNLNTMNEDTSMLVQYYMVTKVKNEKVKDTKPPPFGMYQ